MPIATSHTMTRSEKDAYISHLRRVFGTVYDVLPWITPDKAARAEKERAEILDALSPLASFDCRDTKPHWLTLSPGCRSCVEGGWSCLFINNICRGGCFFCPSEQKNIDVPMTSTISFTTPHDYADYLATFPFTGVAISGGEPFLTFERSIDYITTVRERFGDSLHVWLYTSGLHVTRDRLKQMADAGIDEIRFNICATNYSCEAAKQAAGIIPVVTVEIPAVPEHTALLTEAMNRMTESGINYLNLHQIRATVFNAGKLAAHSYTFLHGQNAGVLESELAALRLLRHAAKKGFSLPVNYCSLTYRNRYQSLASRRRFASSVAKPFEEISRAGYIRRMALIGDPETLAARAAEIRNRIGEKDTWHYDRSQKRLFLTRDVLGTFDLSDVAMTITYAAAAVHPALTYRNPFREIPLNTRKSIIVERAIVSPEILLSPPEAAAFIGRYLAGKSRPVTTGNPPEICGHTYPGFHSSDNVWRIIDKKECLPRGLLEYF